MTKYFGQFSINGQVYDVVIQIDGTERTLKYRESERSAAEKVLHENLIGADGFEIGDYFGSSSKQSEWKMTVIKPNGTGKSKLEAKVRNFLSTNRK